MGAYTVSVQTMRLLVSLTWPEQFTFLSLIDVPNRFANQYAVGA